MKRGIFCVKDNYRSEISQVRVGDQFVIVIPRDGEKKKIAGLYEVIDDEPSNPYIRQALSTWNMN